MRGRAFGFGASISSIVLFINLAHRSNNLLYERNLVLRDVVLFIEQLICPQCRPLLNWNERVNPAGGVVRWFVQKN